MVDFTLSEKQTIALDILDDSTTTDILYGGSAGGGKSFFGCFWQIRNRLLYPKSRGIILRKSLKDLISITIDTTFKEVAEMMGAGKYWNYKINQQTGVITFDNESMIYLRDAAYNPSDINYDRLKVEVTDAFIEEATQVPEQAYKMIRSRIRYMVKDVPKLLITSNPAECWVKYEFIKDKNGHHLTLPPHKKFVQAFVSDNPNRQFAKQYTETLEGLDPKLRDMYLYGNWDLNVNDNPFFYSYNQRHSTLESYSIDRSKPIQLSFDFNQDPCVCVVSQRMDKSLNIFDTIIENHKSYAGLSPLEAVCKTIKQKYLDTNIVKPYYIQVTGDASGRSGSADRQDNYTFYTTIAKSLGINPIQIVTRKMNTTHVFSGRICNEVLRSVNIKFWNVPELTADINRAYSDNEGSLNEAKKKHGLHLVDAFRYLIDMYFSYTGNGYYTDINLIIANIKRYATISNN
jgi:hypothetical protein